MAYSVVQDTSIDESKRVVNLSQDFREHLGVSSREIHDKEANYKRSDNLNGCVSLRMDVRGAKLFVSAPNSPAIRLVPNATRDQWSLKVAGSVGLTSWTAERLHETLRILVPQAPPRKPRDRVAFSSFSMPTTLQGDLNLPCTLCEVVLESPLHVQANRTVRTKGHQQAPSIRISAPNNEVYISSRVTTEYSLHLLAPRVTLEPDAVIKSPQVQFQSNANLAATFLAGGRSSQLHLIAGNNLVTSEACMIGASKTDGKLTGRVDDVTLDIGGTFTHRGTIVAKHSVDLRCHSISQQSDQSYDASDRFFGAKSALVIESNKVISTAPSGASVSLSMPTDNALLRSIADGDVEAVVRLIRDENFMSANHTSISRALDLAAVQASTQLNDDQQQHPNVRYKRRRSIHQMLVDWNQHIGKIHAPFLKVTTKAGIANLSQLCAGNLLRLDVTTDAELPVLYCHDSWECPMLQGTIRGHLKVSGQAAIFQGLELEVGKTAHFLFPGEYKFGGGGKLVVTESCVIGESTCVSWGNGFHNYSINDDDESSCLNIIAADYVTHPRSSFRGDGDRDTFLYLARTASPTSLAGSATPSVCTWHAPIHCSALHFRASAPVRFASTVEAAVAICLEDACTPTPFEHRSMFSVDGCLVTTHGELFIQLVKPAFPAVHPPRLNRPSMQVFGGGKVSACHRVIAPDCWLRWDDDSLLELFVSTPAQHERWCTIVASRLELAKTATVALQPYNAEPKLLQFQICELKLEGELRNVSQLHCVYNSATLHSTFRQAPVLSDVVFVGDQLLDVHCSMMCSRTISIQGTQRVDLRSSIRCGRGAVTPAQHVDSLPPSSTGFLSIIDVSKLHCLADIISDLVRIKAQQVRLAKSCRLVTLELQLSAERFKNDSIIHCFGDALLEALHMINDHGQVKCGRELLISVPASLNLDTPAFKHSGYFEVESSLQLSSLSARAVDFAPSGYVGMKALPQTSSDTPQLMMSKTGSVSVEVMGSCRVNTHIVEFKDRNLPSNLFVKGPTISFVTGSLVSVDKSIDLPFGQLIFRATQSAVIRINAPVRVNQLLIVPQCLEAASTSPIDITIELGPLGQIWCCSFHVETAFKLTVCYDDAHPRDSLNLYHVMCSGQVEMLSAHQRVDVSMCASSIQAISSSRLEIGPAARLCAQENCDLFGINECVVSGRIELDNQSQVRIHGARVILNGDSPVCSCCQDDGCVSLLTSSDPEKAQKVTIRADSDVVIHKPISLAAGHLVILTSQHASISIKSNIVVLQVLFVTQSSVPAQPSVADLLEAVQQPISKLTIELSSMGHICCTDLRVMTDAALAISYQAGNHHNKSPTPFHVKCTGVVELLAMDQLIDVSITSPVICAIARSKQEIGPAARLLADTRLELQAVDESIVRGHIELKAKSQMRLEASCVALCGESPFSEVFDVTNSTIDVTQRVNIFVATSVTIDKPINVESCDLVICATEDATVNINSAIHVGQLVFMAQPRGLSIPISLFVEFGLFARVCCKNMLVDQVSTLAIRSQHNQITSAASFHVECTGMAELFGADLLVDVSIITPTLCVISSDQLQIGSAAHLLVVDRLELVGGENCSVNGRIEITDKSQVRMEAGRVILYEGSSISSPAVAAAAAGTESRIDLCYHESLYLQGNIHLASTSCMTLRCLAESSSALAIIIVSGQITIQGCLAFDFLSKNASVKFAGSLNAYSLATVTSSAAEFQFSSSCHVKITRQQQQEQRWSLACRTLELAAGAALELSNGTIAAFCYKQASNRTVMKECELIVSEILAIDRDATLSFENGMLLKCSTLQLEGTLEERFPHLLGLLRVECEGHATLSDTAILQVHDLNWKSKTLMCLGEMQGKTIKIHCTLGLCNRKKIHAADSLLLSANCIVANLWSLKSQSQLSIQSSFVANCGSIAAPTLTMHSVVTAAVAGAIWAFEMRSCSGLFLESSVHCCLWHPPTKQQLTSASNIVSSLMNTAQSFVPSPVRNAFNIIRSLKSIYVLLQIGFNSAERIKSACNLLRSKGVEGIEFTDLIAIFAEVLETVSQIKALTQSIQFNDSGLAPSLSAREHVASLASSLVGGSMKFANAASVSYGHRAAYNISESGFRASMGRTATRLTAGSFTADYANSIRNDCRLIASFGTVAMSSNSIDSHGDVLARNIAFTGKHVNVSQASAAKSLTVRGSSAIILRTSKGSTVDACCSSDADSSSSAIPSAGDVIAENVSGDTILLSSNGRLSAHQIAASSSVSLTAGFNMQVTGLTSSGDALMRSQGNLNASGVSGVDVSATSEHGSTDLTNVQAQGHLQAQAMTSLRAELVSSGQSASFSAGSAMDVIAASAGGEMQFQAQGDLRASDVSGTNVVASSEQGSVNLLNVRAQERLYAQAKTDLQAHDISSGQSTFFTAGSAMHVSSLCAGGDASMHASGNVRAVGVSGANVSIKSEQASVDVNDIRAQEHLRVEAKTDLHGQEVVSNKSMLLVSGNDMAVAQVSGGELSATSGAGVRMTDIAIREAADIKATGNALIHNARHGSYKVSAGDIVGVSGHLNARELMMHGQTARVAVDDLRVGALGILANSMDAEELRQLLYSDESNGRLNISEILAVELKKQDVRLDQKLITSKAVDLKARTLMILADFSSSKSVNLVASAGDLIVTERVQISGSDVTLSGHSLLRLAKGATIRASGTAALESAAGHISLTENVTTGRDVNIVAQEDVNIMRSNITAFSHLHVQSKQRNTTITGSRLRGDVFAHVEANGNVAITADHDSVQSRYGTIETNYTRSEISGGAGIEYDAEDGKRGLAVLIQSHKGDIEVRASSLAAVGDVAALAHRDVRVLAEAENRLVDRSVKRSWLKKKVSETWAVHVEASSIASAGGKITLNAANGSINAVAATFASHQGNHFFGSKGTKIQGLQTTTFTTKSSSFLGIRTGSSKERHGVAHLANVVDIAPNATSVLTSAHGDVSLIGAHFMSRGHLKVSAPQGKFSVKSMTLNHRIKESRVAFFAKLPAYDRLHGGLQSIINSDAAVQSIHNLQRSGGGLDTVVTATSTAKQLQQFADGLQSAIPNHSLGNFATERLQLGDSQHIINPKVELGIRFEASDQRYQTLDGTSVQAGSLDVHAKSMEFLNAASLSVEKDATLNVKSFVLLASQLNSSNKHSSTSFSVSGSALGGFLDATAAHSRSSAKANSIVNQQTRIGKLHLVGVESGSLIGANLRVGSISSDTPLSLKITSLQSTSETHSKSGSASFSGVGSYSESNSQNRVTDQQSSLEIEHGGGQDLSVGTLELTGGAVISNDGVVRMRADTIINHELKDESQASGFSLCGPPLFGADTDPALAVGFSRHRDQYTATQRSSVASTSTSHGMAVTNLSNSSGPTIQGVALNTDANQRMQVTRQEHREMHGEFPVELVRRIVISPETKTVEQLSRDPGMLELVNVSAQLSEVVYGDNAPAYLSTPAERIQFALDRQQQRHLGSHTGDLLSNYKVDPQLCTDDMCAFVDKSTTKCIVTFRGTANATDLVRDTGIFMNNRPLTGGPAAEAFLARAVAKYGSSNVVSVGHSLGGTQAIAAGQKANVPIVVFNPGMGLPTAQSIRNSAAPSHHSQQSLTIVRTSADVVSLTSRVSGPRGDNVNTVVIPSSMSPLQAHSLSNFTNPQSALVEAAKNAIME